MAVLKNFIVIMQKVFRSKDLHLPCAKLGIAVIHSKPYDSASRGKIERFFRTGKDEVFAPYR